MNDIDSLIQQQITQWPLAAKNLAALDQVQTRTLVLSPGETFTIQYNPGRITSSTAKTDSQSIGQRPCFLCAKNRPAEQPGLPFKAAYEILVNPFPIFPRHLTIVEQQHLPQRIHGRMTDMLELARELSDFIVFYNGPKCGASAPDHFHFQAGQKGLMPIEEEWSHLEKQLIFNDTEVLVEAAVHYSRKCLVVEGQHPESMVHWMEKIIGCLPANHEEKEEPLLNLLAGYEAGLWRIYLFPRGAHRPRQFFSSGAGQLLLSPASVDFGGLLITPREEDFDKLDTDTIRDIFKQVSLSDTSWQQLLKDLQK
ncbi:DUF4922 domain-containing protein [Geofilum rubicundum]|uniref:DUF4922 domain-containing protein n=1 Tax=Geofilum rubicundum TaxID=472113 RepID=UPI003F6EB00A